MIYQDDNHSCGLAVTRNLLVELAQNRSYGSECFKTDCDTFFKIKKELEQRGVKSEGYLVDEEGLNKIKSPFIAQFKTDVGYHFVLVKRKHGRYRIIDSGRGKYNLSFEEFNQYFTGRVLEVQDNKIVKPQKKRFLKRSEILFLVTISLFELAFMSLALYFTDNQNHLALMLSFFALMSLAVVGKRVYILKLYRKIDRRFLLPYLYNTKDEKNFEHLVKIKNQRLKQLADFLVLIESFALISLYVLFLDRFIFLSIFLALIINIILYFIVKPSEKKSFALSLKEEKGFYEVIRTNGFYSELQKRYLKTTKEGNKILGLELARRGISVFSVALLVLVSALNKNNYSPVFLIFNFFFISYFIDLVMRILDNAMKFDPYLVSLNRLNLKENLSLLDKSEVLGYN